MSAKHGKRGIDNKNEKDNDTTHGRYLGKFAVGCAIAALFRDTGVGFLMATVCMVASWRQSYDNITTTMNTPSGTLYGIGVGPGDPDLLTLAAVNKLAHVDVILAASSSKNDYSLALEIAKPHLPEHTRVEQLKFPMTKDRQELQTAWEISGERAAHILKQGQNAAFLTLGDPMIYSTFGYLLRVLTATHPDIPVEIIPGITSFQAAAAATHTILTESGENLVIFSGVGDEERLGQNLDMADNAVILKSYKNFTSLKDIVARYNHSNAIFVSRLGHADERIARNLDEITEQPHYLSLILTKK